MANVRPFQGVRYNTEKVRIKDVVTQPYDKITPVMQETYYKKNDYNIVRVILPYDSPNKYEKAGEYLRAWLNSGILVRDKTPCIYPYHQEFTAPTGERKTRKGFCAIIKLEDFSTGVVLPHERTLSKPKEDRLNLLRATKTHLGQIFMLYPDEKNFVTELLAPATSLLPVIEVEESFEEGVIHKIWKVTDGKIINEISKFMADKSILIADGHHRYETALSYSRENPDAGYVMVTFVSTSDKGLVILPTHRALYNIKVEKNECLKALNNYFSVKKQHSLESLGIKRHTFGLYIDREFYRLELKNSSIMDRFVEPDRSEEYKNLDITVLHSCIIEGILGISKESIARKENIEYLRDAKQGIKGVDSGRFSMLFLLPPTGIDEVRRISQKREAMPQKSTDFYPKLITGLVMCRI
ncbi:MAG: DUF1015 domain-containing protein [candidate division WOR-3 bacterium]|nr:DUF1015 domain-containing protein [candidate division WOR-3 bacterium]